MNAWEHFLNSLATRGGNIFLLWISVGILGYLVYHSLHHVETVTEVRTVILSTFSAFTGALLQALMGGTNTRQRAADTNGGTDEKKP